MLFYERCKVKNLFDDKYKIYVVQESFSEKMRNMEEVIRRQEDLIVKLQAK